MTNLLIAIGFIACIAGGYRLMGLLDGYGSPKRRGHAAPATFKEVFHILTLR